MARTREIKKRIGAVGTIQRITRTMQMIATAKFTYSLTRAKGARPYTDRLRRLVAEVLASGIETVHPLMEAPAESPARELLLVITSDRGMCGAYNANVMRAALAHVRQLEERGRTQELESSGRKAVGYFRFQRLDIARRHTVGDRPPYEKVAELADRYIAAFMEGRFDAVAVASMRFVSNTRQVPQVMRLLPLEPPPADDEAPAAAEPLYELSPSAEVLLGDLLPLSVKTSLFQAFLDAAVSEQIMRMVAMKAATENAKELGKTLTRRFNRARQSQITTELMEIIAGAAALE